MTCPDCPLFRNQPSYYDTEFGDSVCGGDDRILAIGGGYPDTIPHDCPLLTERYDDFRDRVTDFRRRLGYWHKD